MRAVHHVIEELKDYMEGRVREDVNKFLLAEELVDGALAQYTGGSFWANNLGYSDFKHCGETLYRTPRGNWFTVGYGGPLSKYARSDGGNGMYGQRDVFRPLTPGEAMEFLEEHGEAEDIETHFGDSVEDA